MDIGGQALIEGVMIRSKEKVAIAVRKKEKIKTVTHPTSKISKKLAKIPLVRGIVVLIDSMVIGTKALIYSAKEQEEKEGEITNTQIAITTTVSFILAIGLFIVLPLIISKLLTENRFLFNLIDGLLRIIIFLGYLLIVSKSKEIQRIFQYHGAEHMSVHCFEHKEKLTVENVKKYSTVHPRCGTSFLIIVLLLSILIFSVVWHEDFVIKILQRIILVPVIAAISYEMLKFSAKHNNLFFIKALAYPGLLMQKITTKQPEDAQIEVAIAAVKAATN